MTEENIDPDQEFSIQDSTEEFETSDETSDTYEPIQTDFDQDSSVVDQEFDQNVEGGEYQATDPDQSQPSDISDAPNSVQISEPEQKTSSPQSFRVMRFEDFLNQPAD